MFLLLLPHSLENILKTNKLERTKVFAGGTSPSSGFFMFFRQILNLSTHFLHNFKVLVCLTIG
jgi:hypothetical protein